MKTLDDVQEQEKKNFVNKLLELNSQESFVYFTGGTMEFQGLANKPIRLGATQAMSAGIVNLVQKKLGQNPIGCGNSFQYIAQRI